MKKNLEKKFVEFLRGEVLDYKKEKSSALREAIDDHHKGIINNDSFDMIIEDIYTTYDSNVEHILLMGISRGCSYKSLYGITRTAYFADNTADILNDILYRVREMEAI